MGSESRKNQTWPIFPSTSLPVPLRLTPELPAMLPRKPPLKLNPLPPFSSDTTSIFSSDPATINTTILLPIMLHPLLLKILFLMLPSNTTSDIEFYTTYDTASDTASDTTSDAESYTTFDTASDTTSYNLQYTFRLQYYLHEHYLQY